MKKLPTQSVFAGFFQTLKSVVAIAIFAILTNASATIADPPIVIIDKTITPPPFPPNVPSLASDESMVIYHYEITGTGYWQGDPEYHIIGLVTACEEQTTHYKTNGTTSGSSRSALGDFGMQIPHCPLQGWLYWSNYTTCLSTDVSCSATTYWYDDTYGANLGSDYGGSDIIQLGTNYLSCGTILKHESFYRYTLNPPGQNEGGACGRVPTTIMTGQGRLYQIDLTLTPGCSNNSIPLSWQWNDALLPFATAYPASGNPTTPANGAFDSNGNFQFSFTGQSNTVYCVFASTNYETWENVGEVYLADTNTLGSFVDTNAPSCKQRYYMTIQQMEMDEDHTNPPSDAYGFVKINVTTNGALVANPLVSSNMSISSLLASLPNSTTLQLWDQTNWGPTATFSAGSWDQPYWQLTPGNGAFIHPSTNTTLTFIGQPVQGYITNFIPSGMSVRSSALAMAGGVDTLGLLGLTNGDSILKRSGAGYVAYTNILGTWHPSTPTLSVGEAIIINSANGTNWSQFYQTPPYIDALTLSNPLLFFWNATTTYSDPTGNMYFYWDNYWWNIAPRYPAIPDGAIFELAESQGEHLVLTAPATNDSLSGEGTEMFTYPDDYPPDYQPSQGVLVYVRYRNGNFCGPWSNGVLPYYVP